MKSKRIYGLDILRAVAILSVLVNHSSLLFPEYIYKPIWTYVPDGVAIFFVLSGFLIGGILLKKINQTDFKTRQLMDFWVRRWLRTLPAFFVTLSIVIIVLYLQDRGPGIISIIKGLTFSQSLFKDHEFFYNEGWSLCVEEWFYLLIPAILFFCFKFTKDRKKTFLATALSIIAMVTLARFLRLQQINYPADWDLSIRRPTFMRLDSIMYGMIGAFLYHYKYKIWQSKNLLFWIGMAILIFIKIRFAPGVKVYLGLSLESFGTLLLLPKLNSIKSGTGVIFRFLSFVSLISYSLYLMNYTPYNIIPYYFIRHYSGIPTDNIWFAILAFILYYAWAFGSAYIMYGLIERPFMRLRNRVPSTELHPNLSDCGRRN